MSSIVVRDFLIFFLVILPRVNSSDEDFDSACLSALVHWFHNSYTNQMIFNDFTDAKQKTKMLTRANLSVVVCCLVCCSTACPQGTYGQACNGLCRCQNGGSCDPGTGSCLCPTGVQGLLCEDGWYTPHAHTHGCIKKRKKVNRGKRNLIIKVTCVRQEGVTVSAGSVFSQVVRAVTLGGSVWGNATVPTTDTATVCLDPACARRDCTGGSATCVSTLCVWEVTEP